MRRPIVLATLSFCPGILLADKIHLNFWVLFSAIALLLLLSFCLRRTPHGYRASFLLAVFLMGVVSLKNARTLPADHILHFILSPSKKEHIVRGIVARAPKIKDKGVSFVFNATGIGDDGLISSCRGKVLVRIKGRQGFEYGDELFLLGRLSRPWPPKNLKAFNFRDYLYNQGIYLVMRVENDASVIKLASSGSAKFIRSVIRLNKRLEAVILRSHAGFAAGIVDAMVLGQKDFISPLVYDSMVKCGTVHILVVSGFNVGIIAFISMLLLKVLRLGLRVRIVMTILLLILYCFITGSSTPVVRATVMAVIFLIANLIRREPDIYNTLSLAALFILILDVRQIFDLGFQLSFASVISIVYFSSRFKQCFRLALIQPKLLAVIAEAGTVSLSAWLGTFGLVAYYFRIFSPVTVLANVLIVPLATLITLGGLSVLFTAPMFPAVSRCLAGTNELLVALLLFINSFLALIPYAYLSF